MNQNRFPPPTSPQNPNGQHETTAPPTNPVYPDLNTKARITGIYYCPFPRALAKPDHPPWFRGTYMALFFMAMVIVMQLIDAGTIFTPGTMIGLAFLLFVSITLATIGFFILNSNQRTLANWTPLAERNTPANTRCYQVCRSVFQEKIPGGSFKKLDPRATPLLRRVTSNQIQAIADDQYQSALEAIELSPHLRDPAHVESGFSIPPILAGISLFLIPFCIFFAFAQGNWFMFAIYLLWGGQLLYSIRPIRLRIREHLNLNPYRSIIGPGVIIDHKNRRWTVNDSILLLNKGPLGCILITIINPNRRHRFIYKKFDHPDFITLWQNWNHPHPRPELLT